MSVAFDTLKFARGLRDNAGMSAEQAEGVAVAFSSATSEQLATKLDLAELGANLRAEIAPIKSDVQLLKWMVGFVLAAVVAVFFMLLRH